jgi:hypothetical protein
MFNVRVFKKSIKSEFKALLILQREAVKSIGESGVTQKKLAKVVH